MCGFHCALTQSTSNGSFISGVEKKKIAEFSLFPYAFWLAICAQYAIELSCTHSVRLLFVCLFVCTFRSISLVLIVIITVIIIIINIHSHWHSQFRLRISTLAIISVFIHIGFGVMDILPMKKLEKKYGLDSIKKLCPQHNWILKLWNLFYISSYFIFPIANHMPICTYIRFLFYIHKDNVLLLIMLCIQPPLSSHRLHSACLFAGINGCAKSKTIKMTCNTRPTTTFFTFEYIAKTRGGEFAAHIHRMKFARKPVMRTFHDSGAYVINSCTIYRTSYNLPFH